MDVEGLPGGAADVQVFFRIGGAVESSELTWNRETLCERIPDHLLAIARDSFGSAFCISLQGANRGAVSFCDLQSVAFNYEADPNFYPVAPDFDGFLNRLRKFWFYRTLRNAVVDYYRRKGAAVRALERMASEMKEAAEPDAELRTVVCQCVSQLVSTLKPEYEQALRRIEVDGLTMQQFAQESGVTANNAAVRVFRARQALRSQVLLACGTCAEHGCLDCQCQASDPPLTPPGS